MDHPSNYKFIDKLLRQTPTFKLPSVLTDYGQYQIQGLNPICVRDQTFEPDVLLNLNTHQVSSLPLSIVPLGSIELFESNAHNLDKTVPSQPIYGFRDAPGALFIPEYLSFENQLCLGNECLRSFIQPVHPSNLYPEGLSLKNTCLSNTTDSKHNIENDLYRENHYWPNPSRELNKKLRWVTLGHRYNWNKREYDGIQQEFSRGLQVLSQNLISSITQTLKDTMITSVCPVTHFLAKVILDGWIQTTNSCVLNNHLNHYFSPDTAIINIYRGKDRLGGHIDDAESDRLKPLISVSLGLPCLFCLKAVDDDNSPITSLVLRSGDILILSGIGRRLLHGVPRLITHSEISNSLDHLNTKERRRRKRLQLLESQKKNDKNHIKNDQLFVHGRQCEMDTILSYDDVLNNANDVIYSRINERSGIDRQKLIQTLQQCRFNLSIREVHGNHEI